MDDQEMQDQVSKLSLPDLFRMRDTLGQMKRLISSECVDRALEMVKAEIEIR